MYSLNFQILLVLASFGGHTNTVLSMVLPCRKAVFTSKEFNVHWLDDMPQDNWSPSLEEVGLSALKFCSSSKPLAHRWALMIFFLLTTFSFINHLRKMHCWPKSSISSYTCSFRHWLSSIILASSCLIYSLLSRFGEFGFHHHLIHLRIGLIDNLIIRLHFLILY